MSLPEWVVRRPVTTSMFFIAVVLFGIFSLGRLAIDLIPEVSFPSLSISSSYSGVAPEEIERLLTIPLEQAVSSVNGVTGMQSTSREGSSRITLQFDWGTDLQAAANEVRANVERVRSRLPDDASAPSVGSFDPNRMPIMTIALGGNLDSASLRRLAEEEFTYYLERIDGVAAISVLGGRTQEILVKLDPVRLQAHGLTVDQVVQAIRSENFNLPAGRVIVGEAQFTLRSVGELGSIQELESILVARRNGVKTYLQDIAEIEGGGDDGGMIVRVDGQPGITLSVQKQSGANTVQVAQAVSKTLDDLRLRYPELNIRIVSDSSVYIRQSVNNVVTAGLFGALLAALLLLLFLHSVRLTAIIAVAIPVSFVGSFILIERAGMTLNIMSLGGLALGVGMLVDNSIVVLENIYRHIKEGKSAKEAAVVGTKEMSSAIVASTLTTLAVFLPMMFVSGMTGILFRQLSLMVAFSIMCSLVVALTLLPVMSAYLLHRESEGQNGGFFGRVGRWIEGLLAKNEEKYAGIVRRAVRRPGLVVGVTSVVFVASLLLVPLLGSELMPVSDEGELTIYFSLPSGTKLETTDAMAWKVEEIIRERVPELRAMDVRVGSGGGRGTNSGSINLVLTPRDQRSRSTDEVVSDLRSRLSEIPGLTARVWVRSNMAERMASGSFGGGSERISIYVQGYQLPVIRQTASDLVGIIEQIPGVINASVARDEEQPEFVIRIDKERAADVGLSATQVASTVQAAVQGRTASQLRVGAEEFPIRVAVGSSTGMLPAEIEALPIPVGGGQYVPLRSVGSLVVQDSPAAIERMNQQRTVRVTASPEGRDLGSVIADIREAVYSQGVPEGVMVYFGGEYEEQQRAFRELITVLLLAVALVYSVMASQFESLFDPLLVMFSIPFALVGVITTLFLTDTPLTTQAFMGLIMLGGIVVNNAIVLISYINLLREQGVELVFAVEQAARTRLRPILLTTGSTVLGLLPMALELGEGSEIQAPLARTVIGGLLVATGVTLILIPTLYHWAHRAVESRRARRRGAQAAALSVVLMVAVLAGGVFTDMAAASGVAPELTLQAAIEQAFAANPKVESALAKLADAESKLRQARAAYRPRLELDGDWEVRRPTHEPEDGFSQSRAVGVELKQVFPTGSWLGAPNEQVKLATLSVESAAGELAHVRAGVVIGVMSAYADVLNAQAQLELSEYASSQAEANVTEAEFRFNQGMLSRIELQRARSQLASAELAVARARNSQKLALARLNTQMGADLWTQWQLSDYDTAMSEVGGAEKGLAISTELAEATVPEPDLKQALGRFELQQVRSQLLRAQIAAENRVKGTAPVVTVGAGVTESERSASLEWNSNSQDTTLVLAGELHNFRNGTFERTGSPGNTTPYWSVGLSVSWPLYDGGIEREKSLQEAVQIKQLEKQVSQQEELVTLEVYEAFFALQEARTRAEIATAQVQTAGENLALSRQRAELGTATATEVLDVELAYLEAVQEVREAQWSVVLGEFRYLQASGQEVWPW